MPGEVRFEAQGTSYALRYSVNRLVAMEEATDMSVAEIVERMASGDVRFATLRAIFAAGLGEAPDRAGAVMDDIGIARAMELIGDAFAKAFPEAGTGNAAAPEVG